jgi:hypothetical protein
MSPSDEKESESNSHETSMDRLDYKVPRLIDTYGLGAEYGDSLEDRWTADTEQRLSLRSLADRFNKQLLETAMVDAGMSPLAGEVANLYRLLTEDDISSGNRTEARKRLEQEGVDIDQLEQDFVTYQAIRSYLKEYRGAKHSGENGVTRTENVVETVQRLKSRVSSVAKKNLTQLRDGGRISLGEFRLFVEITVFCQSCNTQKGIVELLQQGGCECHNEDTGEE